MKLFPDYKADPKWAGAATTVLGNDTQFAPIARAKSLFADLPELILLIGSEPMNQDAHDALDSLVSEAGRVQGRAAKKVESDGDEVEKQIEYTRPNGEKYYARKWENGEHTPPTDVEVLLQARAAKMPIFMYGPPGTGKTALAEAAYGKDLITVIMTADTDELSLIGQFIPDPQHEGGYRWIDGPLLRAAKEGLPILLDEVGIADPKVLTTVYGAMDGRGVLEVNLNPAIGTVKVKEGFYVIGATNPNAPGVNLSEALLSRFTLHVEVTTDWALASTVLNVPVEIVEMAQNMAARVDLREESWAPQMRELLAYRDIKKEFGETFAIRNLITVAPFEARDTLKQSLGNVFGHHIAVEARI